jgi:hypothetical protein
MQIRTSDVSTTRDKTPCIRGYRVHMGKTECRWGRGESTATQPHPQERMHTCLLLLSPAALQLLFVHPPRVEVLAQQLQRSARWVSTATNKSCLHIWTQPTFLDVAQQFRTNDSGSSSFVARLVAARSAHDRNTRRSLSFPHSLTCIIDITRKHAESQRHARTVKDMQASTHQSINRSIEREREHKLQ